MILLKKQVMLEDILHKYNRKMFIMMPVDHVIKSFKFKIINLIVNIVEAQQYLVANIF